MTAPPAPSGRAFTVGLVIGGAVLAFGVGGLLSTTGLGSVRDIAQWVVGADLIHDVVLAPAVALASVVLAKILPLPWRTPIRAALVASGIVTLIVYPALRGFGHDTAPGNTTVQPLDYTTALFTVLGTIWVLALLWLVAIAVERRARVSRGLES